MAERLVAGRLVAGRLVAGRLVAGRLVAGRLVAGWLVAGRLVAERLVAERLVAGRLAAEQLVAELLVAEPLEGLLGERSREAPLAVAVPDSVSGIFQRGMTRIFNEEASMNRPSKWASIGLSLLVPAVVAASVPFTFSAGTPIRASEVNANFAALDSRTGGATRWVSPGGAALMIAPVFVYSGFNGGGFSSVVPGFRSDAGVLWQLDPETGRAIALQDNHFTAPLFESTNCSGAAIVAGAIPPPGGTIDLTSWDAGIVGRPLGLTLRTLSIRTERDSAGCRPVVGYSRGLYVTDFVPVSPPALPPGPYHPEF